MCNGIRDALGKWKARRWEPPAEEALRQHATQLGAHLGQEQTPTGLLRTLDGLKAHDGGPLLPKEAIGALAGYATAVAAAQAAIEASARATEDMRDTSWRLRREYSRGSAHGTTEYMAPELVDSEMRGEVRRVKGRAVRVRAVRIRVRVRVRIRSEVRTTQEFPPVVPGPSAGRPLGPRNPELGWGGRADDRCLGCGVRGFPDALRGLAVQGPESLAHGPEGHETRL